MKRAQHMLMKVKHTKVKEMVQWDYYVEQDFETPAAAYGDTSVSIDVCCRHF